MASPKATKKATKKKPKPADIELQPDAWERFEKAVGTVAPVRRSTKRLDTTGNGED